MKDKVAIAIDEDLLKEVDRLAKKFDTSRSQMIENFITVAMMDVKVLEKLGFMDIAQAVLKVQKRLKMSPT